jgi:hypothetical protein
MINVGQQKKLSQIKVGLIPPSQDTIATNPTSFVNRAANVNKLTLNFETGSDGWIKSFAWLFSAVHFISICFARRLFFIKY